MNRRVFLEAAGLLSAAGILTAAGVTDATASLKESSATPPPDPAALKQLQTLLGYSDAQFKDFLQTPRNQKILIRLEDALQTKIICEVVKVHGCMAGHKVGEQFIFPSSGPLDTRNSAEKLCPFLMPPLTRLVWVVQERIWEGLDPQPLFYHGQCDDVGHDCGGIGRVVIEARIEKTAAAIKP